MLRLDVVSGAVLFFFFAPLVFAHPIIAVVLAFFVVPWLTTFVLHCLGCRERGVLRGMYIFICPLYPNPLHVDVADVCAFCG